MRCVFWHEPNQCSTGEFSPVKIERYCDYIIFISKLYNTKSRWNWTWYNANANETENVWRRLLLNAAATYLPVGCTLIARLTSRYTCPNICFTFVVGVKQLVVAKLCFDYHLREYRNNMFGKTQILPPIRVHTLHTRPPQNKWRNTERICKFKFFLKSKTQLVQIYKT